MKTIPISERQHEYITNKAGAGGIMYRVLEEIIEEDMGKKENKKFLPPPIHLEDKRDSDNQAKGE